MEDILYNAALTFSNVMKYDYIYTLGRKTVLKISVLSNRSYLFTHVCGLDHLKEPPVITANNEAQKKKVYKKILQKKITFSFIKATKTIRMKISVYIFFLHFQTVLI